MSADQAPAATTVTIPEDVYDALLRLATAHKRAVCDCENCPPDKAFQYDNCECGEDWSTCSDDVAVLDAYVPNWSVTAVDDGLVCDDQ